MNDKDLVGLSKFILLIVVEMILPLLVFEMFFIIFCIIVSDLIIPDFIMIFLIIIFCILPIVVYFLLPIVITILAIRQHWSSYLDKFFNQLKLPTIILGLVIIVIIIYEKLNIMMDYSYSCFWIWFYFAIILPYCLIYSVILVHNLIRIFKERTNKKY